MRKNITQAVTNELLRIICFVIYYVSLIALGVALFVVAIWASFHIVVDVIPEVGNLRAILLLLMAVAGILLMAVMIGIYLVKPIFSFTRNKKETRVEINESDCPELFALISEIANQTKCAMPKHVYLSPDVNACVFYDTSFWSIFFPVKKNLEIGLGLFDGMSVDEVKSVLAHEFGHFSQNSMKIGSTVYVTNTVLYNLINTNDFWDRWLDEWCMSDTGIIRYFGVFTRKLTNGIKRITFGVYKFVQKGYLHLSRHMEYDADNISCACVGSKTFISALCKIEVLSNKDNLYQQFLRSLIDEKHIVSNYFVGKNIVAGLLPYKDMPNFSFDDSLTSPISTYNVQSKIKMEDVWASHPSLDDRIQNALLSTNDVIGATNVRPAWSIIPDNIAEKVSRHFMSLIKKASSEPILDEIPESSFSEWVKKEIDENFMEERLRPFFDRTIFQFDLDEDVLAEPEYPFTEENAQKISELIVGIEDWRTLNQIKEGEIKIREIQYDGNVYKRKNLPIDALKAQLDSMLEDVRKISHQIYSYISNNCDDEKRIVLKGAYYRVFYAQHFNRDNDLLPSLMAHRDSLIQELNRATRRDEEEYNQLCSWVRDYEKHLRTVISKLDPDLLSVIAEEEYIQQLMNYAKEEHNPRYSIEVEIINEMFHVTDAIKALIGHLYNQSKKVICDIAKDFLN